MTRRPIRPALSDSAPRGRVLNARNPVDLLAAVPVVLGFEPAHSVVMLTFGGTHTFHARVDLPPPAGLEEMTDLLVGPAQRQLVHSVVLILYTHDATEARRALRVLERSFTAAGIDVVHTLRADGTRWFGRGAPTHGVPYDLTAHPFRFDSVVEGVVTHGSRAQLAATLRTDPVAAGLVEEHLVATPPLEAPDAYDAFDVASCIAGHLERGTLLSDREIVAVALGISEQVVRDAAWVTMRRSSAAAHVLLWSDVVRRVPSSLVAGPACVLAFAAWLAGNGALAWCALDRVGETDTKNTLAALVGDLLASAVPPTMWDKTMGLS